MAASFDKTCAIVDLSPTPKPLSAKGRQWLLWPVWAYRVVVPQPASERFNLFQRAVLSLCRAGIVHVDEISDRLDLGSELAAYILNQLEGMGLLDRHRELTERAKKLLDEESENQVKAEAGYVFVDPFTSELWPRFCRGVLPYSESEFDGRSAKVERGTVGDPRRENATVIWPHRGDGFPPPPSRRDIVRACSRSIRAEAAYKRSTGEDNSELDGSLLKHHLNQVVLLDDAPEPIFLTTFVFVPQDVSRASLWQVCDPFGLGTSHTLRKQIEELASASSQAGDILKNAIKRATREGFAVDDADFLDLFREQNQKAAEVVNEKAGFDKSICPEVWELLIQMEGERIKVGGEDVSGRAWDREQEVLKAMVRRAYEAVEECLANVVRTFRGSEIWSRLGGAPEDNGALLKKIACELGFVDEEAPCFERFLRIGSGPVEGVVLHENRELVALFAAALLSAQDHPEHPLRRCVAEFPELIVFLNELKRMRGQAAHHTRVDWEKEDREKALDFRKNTYHVARILLPTVEGTTTDSQSSPAPTEWGADLVYRLRAQAAYNVEDEFGLHIREVLSLRDELVEVEVLSLELDKLRRAGAIAEEVDGRTKDMRIACGNAVEAAVARLLTEADVSEFVTDDRTANAERYSEAARSLGFQAKEDGQYHEVLLKVHPDRVHSVAETRRGALNALLVVALLQAKQDANHTLREVAKANSRFLLDIGEVSQARGHGDGGENEMIDLEALKNHVIAVGKSVLDVLT